MKNQKTKVNFDSMKESGNIFSGKCPFCDSQDSFTINTKKENFDCFKCNRNGFISELELLVNKKG